MKFGERMFMPFPDACVTYLVISIFKNPCISFYRPLSHKQLVSHVSRIALYNVRNANQADNNDIIIKLHEL